MGSCRKSRESGRLDIIYCVDYTCANRGNSGYIKIQMKLKNKTKEKLILELIGLGWTPDKAEIEVEDFPHNAIKALENAKGRRNEDKKNEITNIN